MIYQLRDYQQECSDAAVQFFMARHKKNGLLVVPTGAGKSLIIADIARRLDGNVLVFQPSKEIVEQNYAKLKSYGVDDCAIYSASLNSKNIDRITFATIGSVKAHMNDFKHFKYVIVDECHTCNAQGGMYRDFFDCAERRILGLTATPYRLSASLQYYDKEGKTVFRPRDEKSMQEFDNKMFKGEYRAENKCILKFLTRTRPRIFDEVVYSVDISTLLNRGFLAKVRYFDLSLMHHATLKRNSTGMDFDDAALKTQYQATNLASLLVDVVRRLQRPKSGIPRKGILVFTKFIEESEMLCREIDGCAMITGSTPKKERERILQDFKDGKIKVVSNVGVLTTGFDYPELDTIVMARPTMSLALYYQIVGRSIRPHKDKEEAWFVDLCGNFQRFGRVEDLHMSEPRAGEYIITGLANNKLKQLTNIYY